MKNRDQERNKKVDMPSTGSESDRSLRRDDLGGSSTGKPGSSERTSPGSQSDLERDRSRQGSSIEE